MSNFSETKSSAELEREVEAQRDRVEASIGEIKDRLSPGQLIDELLSYTKNGGSNFASSLGQSLTANPLPAALVGVGLVWLMSSQAGGNNQPQKRSTSADYQDYPYANIRGGALKRISHAADDQGEWWSEFETGTGDRYKARSNAKGHRLGHFTDSAGKFFGGFIDDAGHRVKNFSDEAGNTLDDAAGWASHAWSDLQHGVSEQIDSLASTAKQVGGSMQARSDQMTRQITSLFESQPLVGGALAFAAGAALGAALPHTRQEDRLLGETGDELRKQAGDVAGDLYEKGKEQVGEAYDAVSAKAGEIYGEAKDRLTGPPNGGPSGVVRH
jgi:ElaB/YqjD/DUF883 family membrane-anchored ribosome-binding protein